MTTALDITRQVDELTADRDSLVARLRNAADRLESTGEADAESIRMSLEKYREDFNRLARLLDLNAEADLSTLQSRASRLNEFAPAREILSRVEQIHRTDGSEMPSLDAVRITAQRLSEQMADISAAGDREVEAARSIANGSHPVNALLALVDEPTHLDDESWGRHVETVRNAFGTDVATAVIRGRLERRSHESIGS